MLRAFLLCLSLILVSQPIFADETKMPALEEYGKLPDFEDAVVSPSGKRYAIITRIKGPRLLVIFENEKPLNSINVGDVKIRDIEWASDDILLVDISTTEILYDFVQDKAEFYRTLVIPATGGTNKVVFANEREITPATFGWHGIRIVNGQPHGFFSGVPQEKVNSLGGLEYEFRGGPPALYRVNLTDMTTKRVAQRIGENERRNWLIDRDGSIASILRRADESGDWKITNASGDVLASGTNPLGGVGLLAFGANGNSVIYSRENEETGDTSYFEVPLAGGASKEILPDIRVERVYVDNRTGVLLGYREFGLAGKMVFFDAATSKKIEKVANAFPKLERRLNDWSEGFSTVVLYTEGNLDSGSYWQVDLDHMKAQPIGWARSKIGPEHVGNISTISYKAADGMEMDGILTLPVGKEPKNLPVIMLPHGGPTSHDGPGFDWWAQAIASRGYAVFQPNFRGSTNRDAAFTRAGHGEWGGKMQTDISDGMMHLAKLGIVDPKRACIVGASYGGYAALAGVTLQKGVYRCAVSVAGVADLQMMVSTDIEESGNDPTLRRNLRAEIGRGKELRDVSPRRFAAQADAPILLIHGKDDTVVPYKQSQVMAGALKDAKKPFEFVSLDGEDHWLSLGKTRLEMLEQTVRFIEKLNPPN